MLVENARFQRNAQPFLGFLILPRVFWFFHESFGFPWAIWFCRELFSFAESFFELFGFAVSYLVLSLAFWFFRELFGFALSFLVFPWAIWFRRDLFGFTITVVSHRTNGPLVIMGHVTFFFQLKKKKHLFYLYFSFLSFLLLLLLFFRNGKKLKEKKTKIWKK